MVSIPQQVSKGFTLALLSAVVLFAVSCGSAEGSAPAAPVETPGETRQSSPSTITEDEAMIWLEAPVGVYQTGWARIWEERGSLFVDVDVSPSEAVAQPAHIHRGGCSTLGVIDYRLENIIGGHSLTEFPDLTLRDVATGELSINLHLSFADFSTFTACGEIPALESPLHSNSVDAPTPEQDEVSERGY